MPTNCNVVLDIGPGLVTVLLQVLTLASAAIAAYHASSAKAAAAAAHDQLRSSINAIHATSPQEPIK